MNHERWQELIVLANQAGLKTLVDTTNIKSKEHAVILARKQVGQILREKGISLCTEQRRRLKNAAEQFVLRDEFTWPKS